MDINPKRTLATVGISLLIGGGVLYYQYTSYTPSVASEAKKSAENIKNMATKAGDGEADSNGGPSELALPQVAELAGGATPPPLPESGTLGELPSFDNEKLGPRMREALQKRGESPTGATTGGSSRPASGNGGGYDGGQTSGGGTSGGGTSGGGTSGGGTSDDNPSEGGDYWIDSGTSIRHNSSCELYKTSEGTAGEKDEGTPCRLCGG